MALTGGPGVAAVPDARAAAEIRFGEGRRPEESTHVRLESFDGPLALLLALVEQRRLDVLTVPLGDLAGAYLDAVSRLEAGRLSQMSAFVAICSQLILIKSRAMLPRRVETAAAAEEGPDPEADLRQRLLLYRTYRDAARRLAERLDGGGSFHREQAAAAAAGLAGAVPADEPPLDPAILAGALAASVRLAPPEPPPPKVLPRTVTLEDRAAVIRHALHRAPGIVLQDLLRDVTDRVVVAVTFMAMLELARTRELTIEQREPWGPIHVRPVEAARRRSA